MMSMQQRMFSGDFNLEDFLMQLKQIQKLGPLKDIMKMVPGFSQLPMGDMDVDESVMKHNEAILLSMTREERRKEKVINGSRRKRIAVGSGTSVQEVNQLLKQFQQMKDMIKQLTGMAKRGKKKSRFRLPF